MSKNLIRNRKAWLILLGLGILFAVGSYGWNKASLARVNENAAAAAKKVTSDLAAVLTRAQPSISVQSELTGIAITNIQKNLESAPDNIPAHHVYAQSSMRYAQLEGHPLYLSKEDHESAIPYLDEANESLGKIQEVMQERGITELPAKNEDDRIDLQMITVDKLTVDRLRAEIKTYYNKSNETKEPSLIQLKDVEEQLLALNYNPESRKRKLSYAEDIIYLSHARLLVSNVAQSNVLLQKAKSILQTVAAVPRKDTNDEGLSDNEVAILKRLKFLDSFILEQRAYQAVIENNPAAASKIYRQIIASINKPVKDVRLAMLTVRVNMMQACLAIDKNQPDAANGFRNALLETLNKLSEDHPGAKRLSMIRDQVSNTSTTLAQQLDCHNTSFIMFPLRQVNPVDQN